MKNFINIFKKLIPRFLIIFNIRRIFIKYSNKVLNTFGIVILNKKIIQKTGYELLLPTANYAPWSLDNEFISIYAKIKSHTLVDVYRCFELWSLVEESAKNNGALIEIGVWKGGTGALIAKKAKLLELKETIYLCDTFKGVVKVNSKFDKTYKGGEHNDASKEEVDYLTRETLKLDNVKILEGIFPEDTGLFIQEKVFRFCHIDVDIYQSSKDILAWIWPKMAAGGIIVFDDYGFIFTDGITTLVNEQKKLNDRITIYNLNGHAIIIKL